ncbi:P-loop NTPase fold protein [Agrobacterium tumefaciens]|uniref:P-loop NTPase fold protein n=1 Tax=Agrobacterium tumefaciens TaxID=358 RepID=UPI00046FE2C3
MRVPDWDSLTKRVAELLSTSPGGLSPLMPVLDQAVRFLDVDAENRTLLLRGRSLTLGIVAAGLSDIDGANEENSAAWLADWLKARVGPDHIQRVVSHLQLEPQNVFPRLADGYSVNLTDNVRVLIPVAQAIAVETTGRPEFEARHLVGAMLQTGFLAGQVMSLFGLTLDTGVQQDIKSQFIKRIITPRSGEIASLWERVLDASEPRPARDAEAETADIDGILSSAGADGVTKLAARTLRIASQLNHLPGNRGEINLERLVMSAAIVGRSIGTTMKGEGAGVVSMAQLVSESRFRAIEPSNRLTAGRKLQSRLVPAPTPQALVLLAEAVANGDRWFARGHVLGADALVVALLGEIGSADLQISELPAAEIPRQVVLTIKEGGGEWQSWANALNVSVEDNPVLGSRDTNTSVGSGPNSSPDLRQRTQAYADLGSDSPDRADLIDKLGVSDEAHAFARVAAARNVTTPLAFGIFGEWGSGKSYFMRLIHEHVAYLSKLAEDQHSKASDTFYPGIVQIRFNAWHYVEMNLWASLVDNIFTELDRWSRQRNEGAPDNTILDKLTTARELTLEAAERLVAQRQHQKEAAARLSAAESELAVIKQNFKPTPRTFWKAVEKTFKKEINNKDFKDAAEKAGLDDLVDDSRLLSETLRDVHSETKRGTVILAGFLGRLLRWPSLIMILAIVLLVPLGVTWISAQLGASGISFLNLISGAGGVATLLAAKAKWLLKEVRSGVAKLDEFDVTLETAISAELQKPENGLKKAQEKLAKSTSEASEARSAFQASSEKLAQTTKEYQQETGRDRLLRFVRERATNDHYSKHLGLIASIRKDFTQLSAMMAEASDSPQSDLSKNDQDYKDRVKRLIEISSTNELLLAEEKAELVRTTERPVVKNSETFNRIVLYVDDLDRCPPDKVVQVLQAVHLLLSFPLFVVVVAVDTRWVSRSLEDQYKELISAGAGTGSATPSDYLEKLFQVPYWVRTMTPEASSELAASLISKSVRKNPAPTAAIDLGETRNAPIMEGGSSAVSADRLLTTGSTTSLSGTLTAPSFELQGTLDVVQPDVEALTLSDEEMAFAREIAPWVGHTPRRALRFVNVYRVVKASFRSDEARRLEEGGYRGLMAQLAVTTGSPGHGDVWDRLVSAFHNGEPLDQAYLEIEKTGKVVPSAVRAVIAVLEQEKFPDTVGSDLKYYAELARRYSFEGVDRPAHL